MVTPAVKREAVAHLRGAHEMSERRACRVVGCERVMVRYRSRRPVDPKLRDRLLALARERRRFGYRRLLIFLRREGFVLNHKQISRIYREDWRRDYNTVRLHSRIGWLTPAANAAQLSPRRDHGAALGDGSAPWPVAGPRV